MSLYEKWIRSGYDSKGKSIKSFWNSYMPREQAIYEDILSNKITQMESSVSEIAKKYQLEDFEVIGFLDGINGALTEPLDIESLETETEVKLDIDIEGLYKKMVEYKAEHLYNLPQWDNIFDKEKQMALMSEQRAANTIVKGQKTGRNDPCPCGSGKKYKYCCANA